VPSPLAAFDCRNNRLMLAALLEIADDIAAARRRFGRDRIAVILGTSTSGIFETETGYHAYRERGRWPAEFDYKQHEAGGLSEFAARCLDLSGPAFTVATACSSSAKVFASARRMIAARACDAAIVGGADSLCRLTANGFTTLEAMSPALCNPFSANRDGINIGEASVAFLMTPDSGPVDLIGLGESSDAYHASAPDPDGKGAIDAMREALADAGLEAGEIDYINLHGTGTPLNDAMESRVVAGLFPRETPCSSTKSMTGHMLGAAGACEAAFLWLAMHPDYGCNRLPPHVWDGVPDPALPALALVPHGASLGRRPRTAMLSASYAFAGNNAVVVLGTGRPAP
jgi:3-oxoacyl-[acyl-carrier-protein] synthase-1